jgi:type I restriction enzyme, S subunit
MIVAKLEKVAALIDQRRQAIVVAEREARTLLLKSFERAIDGASYRPFLYRAGLDGGTAG